ncbi:winged helix-turn-helix transcriptional regulator [Winogradskyella echinorum]|uniref:Winged helix-turn-helix transcriptional regulator n=1 Tax=Winogradskyella echinorum TaxID=538189 RepID=A0ABR6Y0V0_9FLAO|nr:winged helix-turn-helix domain-containing protein [Winogradskyella echinorum]MBC3846376.1 winged helix-turn-helix transcriptional regulator [Winogradskyella echinorum]MBC5750724.1 winged helix-turn-helix transcriptional regulator [Winogradskyella echinorum]
MKQAIINTFGRALLFIIIVLGLSCTTKQNVDLSKRTKIALRDAGHKLLLSNQDSTSLILPIIELETNKFQIAFSKTLSFEPSTLVSIVKESIEISNLPEYYLVEVLQCNDREVAYSYQMSAEKESTIIPCGSRYLPEACYLIDVKFINKVEVASINDVVFKTIILLVLASLIFFLKIKTKNSKKAPPEIVPSEKIGSFYFYPDQNKLVKEAEEIALSKKECELLALFVANPNQIIKRDELTKRVWEDNGVFVGRSLDTYISKLRKKLKADTSIKLTNVHGVGYKLEVD